MSLQLDRVVLREALKSIVILIIDSQVVSDHGQNEGAQGAASQVDGHCIVGIGGPVTHPAMCRGVRLDEITLVKLPTMAALCKTAASSLKAPRNATQC